MIRRLAIVMGVFGALMVAGCAPSPAAGNGKEKVVIKGETFELEPAIDDAKREQGLMGRASIPDHGGMLFVFPDSKVRVQSFWMKNCLVDMDIIYLDPFGRVTATHRMKALPPKWKDESEADYEERVREHSYSSGYPAQFAIELQAGSLDRLDVKIEQKIDLDLARLKGMAR